MVALLQGQIPLEYPEVKCLAQGHMDFLLLFEPTTMNLQHLRDTPPFALLQNVFCQCHIHNMEEKDTHTHPKKKG